MPQETVKTATSLAMKIREAFHNALNTSSWVESNVKRVALRKLSNMKFYIGSSGQRLDPAKIDKYYGMQLAQNICSMIHAKNIDETCRTRHFHFLLHDTDRLSEMC